jgi:hypothetical protein
MFFSKLASKAKQRKEAIGYISPYKPAVGQKSIT